MHLCSKRGNTDLVYYDMFLESIRHNEIIFEMMSVCSLAAYTQYFIVLVMLVITKKGELNIAKCFACLLIFKIGIARIQRSHINKKILSLLYKSYDGTENNMATFVTGRNWTCSKKYPLFHVKTFLKTKLHARLYKIL